MMIKFADFLLWAGVIMSLLGLFSVTGYYFSGIIHIGVSEAVHFMDIVYLTIRTAITGGFYSILLLLSMLGLGYKVMGTNSTQDDSKISDTL